MRRLYFFIAVAAATLILSPVPSTGQIFHRNKSNTGASEKPIEWVVTSPGISEQIIRHTGFTVSYNPNLLIPNWVCWELTPEEAAAQTVSRTDFFEPDPMVKGTSAQDTDYRNSGYDRGHMAPAADMKWSEKAMKESFYFSNICPQDKELNAGAWLELEQKCRYWARKYNSPVYIACGPMFIRTEGRFIGENEVVVPDAFFKCVCQNRNGHWVAAAFFFPNVEYGNMGELHVYPFSAIEIMTDLKFFTNLPDGLHDNLSLTINPDDWKVPGWKRQ